MPTTRESCHNSSKRNWWKTWLLTTNTTSHWLEFSTTLTGTSSSFGPSTRLYSKKWVKRTRLVPSTSGKRSSFSLLRSILLSKAKPMNSARFSTRTNSILTNSSATWKLEIWSWTSTVSWKMLIVRKSSRKWLLSSCKHWILVIWIPNSSPILLKPRPWPRLLSPKPKKRKTRRRVRSKKRHPTLQNLNRRKRLTLWNKSQMNFLLKRFGQLSIRIPQWSLSLQLLSQSFLKETQHWIWVNNFSVKWDS